MPYIYSNLYSTSTYFWCHRIHVPLVASTHPIHQGCPCCAMTLWCRRIASGDPVLEMFESIGTNSFLNTSVINWFKFGIFNNWSNWFVSNLNSSSFEQFQYFVGKDLRQLKKTGLCLKGCKILAIFLGKTTDAKLGPLAFRLQVCLASSQAGPRWGWELQLPKKWLFETDPHQRILGTGRTGTPDVAKSSCRWQLMTTRDNKSSSPSKVMRWTGLWIFIGFRGVDQQPGWFSHCVDEPAA